jgi:translation initiation factor 2 gamma subunit (eIF-2gamma)
MEYLKEDGSLDVERIQKLPYKEYIHEISNFTKEQYEEYISKIPMNESQGTVIPIVVEDIEEYIRKGGYVNAWDVINKL